MRRALIGHTGFVGSNLVAAGGYSDLFNSTNVEAMAGQSFDEVVCAGVSAVKWMANKEPAKDLAGIRRLLDVLAEVKARRFVLISTIDVYPDPAQSLDESAVLQGLENHAYGRHRLMIEQWVGQAYPVHSIVRLPALFGPGLKKNAIYDLMTGNQVEKINPAGSFQWYPLDRLAGDLGIVREAGLPLVNLFPEPIAMREIIGAFFPRAAVGPAITPAPSYRVKSSHAGLFGGRDGYVMNKADVMNGLRRFIGAQTAVSGTA